MAGIESFAGSLVNVQIDESDFRSELEVCNLVRNGGTDVAGTNDDNLSSVVHDLFTPHETMNLAYIPLRYPETCGDAALCEKYP